MTTYLSTTSRIARTDPTSGLVNYVNTVKPYHTKILEVLVDYSQSDTVMGSISDGVKFNVQLISDTGNCFTDVKYTYGVRAQTTHVATIHGTIPQLSAGNYIVFDPYDSDFVLGRSVSAHVLDVFYDGVNTHVTVDATIPIAPAVYLRLPTIIGYSCPGGFGDIWDNTPTNDVTETNVGSIAAFGPAYVDFNIASVPALPFAVVSDVESNTMMFCVTTPVISMTLNTRTWVISGDFTNRVYPGVQLVIFGMVGGGNGTYNVVSSSLVLGTTSIVTAEPIPLGASVGVGTAMAMPLVTRSGVFPSFDYDFSAVPVVQEGGKVTLSGELPDGTTGSQQYYLQPITTNGRFALATSRFVQSSSEYVNILSTTTATTTGLTRDEPITPGSVIDLTDTLHHANDGSFTVIAIDHLSGMLYRAWLDQTLANPLLSPSGFVIKPAASEVYGYDPGSQRGCVASCAPNLFAEGHIAERLTFDMDIVFVDHASSKAEEVKYLGWDIPDWDDPESGWDGSVEGPEFEIT